MSRPNSVRNRPSATVEEDWSKITDKTARKRVQNRVAQRNYSETLPAHYFVNYLAQVRPIGRNLKQRIQDLERQNGSECVRTIKDTLHCCSEGQAVRSQDECADTCIGVPLHQHQAGEVHNPHNHCVQASAEPELAYPVSFLKPTLINSQRSPQSLNHLLSLGGTASHGQKYGGIPIPSLRSPIDCSEDSLQVPSEQADEAFSDKDWKIAGAIEEEANDFQPTLQKNSENLIKPNLPVAETDFCSRRSECVARETRRIGKGIAVPGDSAPSKSKHGIDPDGMNRAQQSSTVPDIPPDTASLQERVEFLLECANRVGFTKFDTAISHYYTAEFSQSSIAFNAQRVSRKRHLPEVLALIREKANSWSQWEAQGYRDETLKSSEQFLLEEYRHANSLSDGQIFQHIRRKSLGHKQSPSEDLISDVNKTLQAKVFKSFSSIRFISC
ncbi:hypothetical protein N7449_003805 [Penicillium cf. viridicatum]|uniref:BZIP domain-containing protein n=1 Tax=Penicillium cf. viridicatum TaxID=2972119 RepID=A0A9W9MXL6_9EURO|nr:hypothetical protein N7449_003805 [Penicillium cf. viridicatum]